MKHELKSIGLTDNEVSVYISLMHQGETSVGGIINDLKVHRQIAYNALDALEKRGMVEKTMQNKIYHFKISDPNIILENAQKQELIAKRVSQLIKSEMKKDKREQEINIYNGKEGARKFYLQMFKKTPVKFTTYVLGATVQQHTKILGENFIKGQYTKIKTKRQIFSKLIMSESFREEDVKFNKKTNAMLRETRFLPYQAMNPVTTLIWENSVSFFSTGTDVFVIDIINKEFRDSYMEHFNFLWKMAEK